MVMTRYPAYGNVPLGIVTSNLTDRTLMEGLWDRSLSAHADDINQMQNRYLTAIEFSTPVAKLLIETYSGSNIRCLMSDIIKCRHLVSGKTSQRFHDIYPRLTTSLKLSSNEPLNQRISD